MGPLMSRILYVVNPAAFGGHGSNAWERFSARWPDPLDSEDVRVTGRPGDARRIAAAAEGYDILVAVGGDGTAGEVLSGMMEHAEPRPRLGLVPAGTGNDIARNVGVFSVEDAVAALRVGHARAFDLVRVDCTVNDRPAHRYAFVAVNVGFSAVALRMLRPWMKRWLGATAAYYLAAVLGTFAYRPPVMTVRWDGQAYAGPTWMVVIGNAERMSGGSMRIAPGARPDDGEANVTIVQSRSKARILLTLPTVATGSHINRSFVRYFPAKHIEVTSDPPVGLEIDGDAFGTTPATFTVCPSAVRILCTGTPDG